MTIGADGAVTDTWTVGASHPDFEKAVRSVAKQTWRFNPTGVESFVSVPVVFHTNSRFAKYHSKPDFKCAFDERVPHVEGDSGCTDPVEVTGIRIRGMMIM